MHVLLVEPDEDRRREMAALLREAGHHVLTADDGTLGVQALGPAPEAGRPDFDLLVLDLSLPGLDLDRLRASLRPGEPMPPESLAAAERRQIALALAYTHGNRRDAARLLGIARSTLLNKVRRYGLT